MEYHLSRDFLDGIMLQHPPAQAQGGAEIRAGGQLQFLPSSPDGTLHTALVSFALFAGTPAAGQPEQPFARGGWRILFKTETAFNPTKDPEARFVNDLLVLGAGKLMAQFNNLLMHAQMPIIPFDARQMVTQRPPAPGVAGAAPAAPAAAAGGGGAPA
jgi:hypothetical protein